MDVHRDYDQDVLLIKQFFRDAFEIDDDGQSIPKYREILTNVANREAINITVEVEDVEKFNHDLARQIVRNTTRYVKLFFEALDEILPTYKTKEIDLTEPMDIFIQQRLQNYNRNQATSGPTHQASSQPTISNRPGLDIDGKYPPELVRRYELYFKPTSLVSMPIREVKACYIGHLVTIKGIVTRVTDVVPRVSIVTYSCEQCGCESFQPVSGTEFTPLDQCTSAACKSNKSLGRLTMQTRGAKLIKYQEIKLQEHSGEVPVGHLPRTITVSVTGELTRTCSPGNHISVSGVYLTIDRPNYRMRNAGLTTDTYIDAHYITQTNKTDDIEMDDNAMSEEEGMELLMSGNFLNKLSSSIAPEIYGHWDLKKALLLLLVGGVDKNRSGMKIRGSINICLMGDPGVAKSQLLCFIDRLAARSQYTTGRGSSGVGLTAAVLRDTVTNEFVLEGGALVLADRGVCCIDEFDKMMDADRTAIHEVMEQQTVSIAKAGIMTSLNARTSILAAANPVYGRYNANRTIVENLQLPPALLSRFDLLWLIRDKPDRINDLRLAEHITRIHANPNQRILEDHDAIDMKTMRRYIALCKTKHPIIPEEFEEKLCQIYEKIRAARSVDDKEGGLFTSPRSLLAIVRITTAFARLRLSEVVEEADIDAAFDLYNSSRASLQQTLEQKESEEKEFMSILANMSKALGTCTFDIEDIIDRASRKFSERDVRHILNKLKAIQTVAIDGDIVTLNAF